MKKLEIKQFHKTNEVIGSLSNIMFDTFKLNTSWFRKINLVSFSTLCYLNRVNDFIEEIAEFQEIE
jgi:hypothetical protein